MEKVHLNEGVNTPAGTAHSSLQWEATRDATMATKCPVQYGMEENYAKSHAKLGKKDYGKTKRESAPCKPLNLNPRALDSTKFFVKVPK